MNPALIFVFLAVGLLGIALASAFMSALAHKPSLTILTAFCLLFGVSLAMAATITVMHPITLFRHYRQGRCEDEARAIPQEEKMLDCWRSHLAAELITQGVIKTGEEAVYSISHGWLRHPRGVIQADHIAQPLMDAVAHAHIPNRTVALTWARMLRGHQYLPALSAHQLMAVRRTPISTPRPGLVEYS